MRTIRLSVEEFINGMIHDRQREEARKILGNRTFDVFDPHANLIQQLCGSTYVEKPSYDSLEQKGTCMVWGGKVQKLVLLRNDMLHVEFGGVFILVFKNRKFTLYRHKYENYNDFENELSAGGRSLTVEDYLYGFPYGNGFSFQRYFSRTLVISLVRDFIERCADACFPKDSVELFRQVISENCNPHVTINSILKKNFRTKYDILSNCGKVEGLPKSLNRYNINVGFAIREASGLLSMDSMARLYGRANSERLLECLSNDRMPADSLKHSILNALARFLYPRIDIHVVQKYFSMCQENGLKADITISNEHTMLKRMEAYWKRFSKSHLHVAEPYAKLERLLNYRYHLITTEEELSYEGAVQHNCVRTYLNDIESGRCGIFTLTEDGKRYTIEVNYSHGRYSCSQFLGYANYFTDECRQLAQDFMGRLECLNNNLAS